MKTQAYIVFTDMVLRTTVLVWYQSDLKYKRDNFVM